MQWSEISQNGNPVNKDPSLSDNGLDGLTDENSIGIVRGEKDGEGEGE